jgi:phage virion morphogenesis protein
VTAPKFVWDDAAAQALFRRLIDAGQDTSPLLSKLAYSLTQRARSTLDAGTDPWGTPWTPLAPATIARRRDHSDKPLSDTGHLLASLASALSAGVAEIRIGKSDSPASIHQFGGKAGRGNKVTIPARPMLPIKPGGVVDMPPTWAVELVDAMTSHVEAAIA